MEARFQALEQEIRQYQPEALLLTATLTAVAVLALKSAVPQATTSYFRVSILIAITLVIIIASSRGSLEIKATHTGVSGANCLVFLALLVCGPQLAVVPAGMDALVASKRIRSKPLLYLFNVSNSATSLFLAGKLFALSGSFLRADGTPSVLRRPIVVFAVPLIVLALSHYAINNVVAAVMARSVFRSHFTVTLWRRLPWEPMVYVAEAMAAGVVYYVAVNCDLITAGIGLVLAVPIPVLVYYTFKAYRDRIEERDQHFKEVSEINDSILEMLAMAVDAKDQTTHDHLQRVKLFATRMGQLLDLSEGEIQALKAGALLHDIGKIGVPAYILNKPGKLTQHEFEQMKMHTIIGADMLSNIKFGYPVVPVVRHHHERWDGKGYPDGLKGDQIPITARILTLVDCYDAIRSDRPYHKAMDRERAINYLNENKEVFFDPRLVDLFVSQIDELEAQAAQFKPQARKATSVSAAVSDALKSATPAAGLDTSEAVAGQSRVTAALHTIAEANHRVSELYEITRNLAGAVTLEQTSAILSERLSKLMPFTTCAISLFDANRSEFEVMHADGRHAELFARRRFPISAGIVGWVIQNQRPMYNTNPLLDLGFLTPESANEYKGVMVFPLLKNDNPLGAIALYSTEIQNYTSEYIQLMDSIAQSIADSIHNALALQKAHQAALIDPVTGLSNMAAFSASFERELARGCRSGMPLSVVVVSVNNLAESAATSGRREEELMGQLGKLIKSRLRESDLIARNSASSFVLLLTDSGLSEALEVLARMNDTIARSAQGATLSIEIGAASAPDDGETLPELVKIAVVRSLPVREVLAELGLGQGTVQGSGVRVLA
ncbi:MAG TPA: HD domain-containing phosphohydrolase [Blastocatellia bacterium]